MEFTVANILQIVILFVGGGIAYGVLDTKIKNIEAHKKICEKKFDAIDSRHNNAIDSIQAEIRAMSASLNQLIGRIDAMFTRQEGS
jgi:hypothetical protein